jgi:hypothetical protein
VRSGTTTIDEPRWRHALKYVDRLTPRERELCTLLAEGSSHQSMADQLEVTEVFSVARFFPSRLALIVAMTAPSLAGSDMSTSSAPEIGQDVARDGLFQDAFWSTGFSISVVTRAPRKSTGSHRRHASRGTAA